MAFQKINVLSKLSLEEIQREVIKQEKEIFEIKFEQRIKQTAKPHIIKKKKHYLAQLLTLVKQKQ
uniref:Ribosomal protein L29 n=1 Tax=Sporolithon durum TaxID=48970 RepID=A0A141SD89_9FLOR|nr:ribosomal protein L29 [Sporolithon durum]AMK96257.1 ribosomal protein L29 [Sporolithon durum]